MSPERPRLPSSEQLALFDAVTTPSPAAKPLDRRAAFGRVPKADFIGLNPSQLLEGLTDEDFVHITPDFLEGHLYGYSGPDDFFYKGLAFSPKEYEVIVRSHQHLATSRVGKTLVARELEPLDHRVEAASKSVAHTMASKQDKIEAMLEGYAAERQRLLLIRRAIDSRGYSRMSEAALRVLVNDVVELSFKNIVKVVGLNHHWSEATQNGAKQAMVAQLWGGKYRENFKYFESMTALALKYNRHKNALVSNNLNHTKAAIAKRQSLEST